MSQYGLRSYSSLLLYQLSYEATPLGAGKLVELMCSRERADESFTLSCTLKGYISKKTLILHHWSKTQKFGSSIKVDKDEITTMKILNGCCFEIQYFIDVF